MNIREKITAWEPGAVWSEAGDGMFTVPVEKFHALAARLRAEGFDFLRSLTGMDWGEEGLGTVYHLEATRTGANVVLRTLTADRENPALPTVCLRSATCGRLRNSTSAKSSTISASVS